MSYAGAHLARPTLPNPGMAMASALITRQTELLEILVEIATHHSAVDELHRSVATLAGSRWELARNAPRRLERLAVFLPSNNVLYSYVLFGLVPALFCEEVVIRPSARIKQTALAIQEVLAGEMEAVLGPRVRMTDASQRTFAKTCASADAVVFTGQYENAQEVRAQIGLDPTFLFFGSGPNPFVVGPQAGVADSVRHALASRLYNSGQDCLCSDVFFVHTSLVEEWTAQLTRALSRLEPGERSDPAAVIAPLVYADAVETAAEFVDDHRERVVCGGGVDRGTGLVEPTLVLIEEGLGLHPPELFSPLFCVVPYANVEELRRWLCSPVELERGMYAIVFGEPGLADQVVGTTVISQRRIALDVENGNQPFGGYGLRASSAGDRTAMTGRPLLLSNELRTTPG
jgi:acyl-CoA reductase-like NAD-dependent aldehyde dehydrogenase